MGFVREPMIKYGDLFHLLFLISHWAFDCCTLELWSVLQYLVLQSQLDTCLVVKGTLMQI